MLFFSKRSFSPITYFGKSCTVQYNSTEPCILPRSLFSFLAIWAEKLPLSHPHTAHIFSQRRPIISHIPAPKCIAVSHISCSERKPKVKHAFSWFCGIWRLVSPSQIVPQLPGTKAKVAATFYQAYLYTAADRKEKNN